MGEAYLWVWLSFKDVTIYHCVLKKIVQKEIFKKVTGIFIISSVIPGICINIYIIYIYHIYLLHTYIYMYVLYIYDIYKCICTTDI